MEMCADHWPDHPPCRDDGQTPGVTTNRGGSSKVQVVRDSTVRVCNHTSCPHLARKGGRCRRHQDERQSSESVSGSILKKQCNTTYTTATTSISSHSLPRPSSTASLSSSMVSSGLDSKATNGSTIDAVDTIGKKRSRSKKSEKRWTCPKCLGDVRLPPAAANSNLKSVPEEEEGEEEEPRKMNYHEEEVKAMLRMTPVMCARRGCAAPRYHLECSGLQVGSQIYRKTILTCQATANRPVAAGNYYPALKDVNYDATKILNHLYHGGGTAWWELSPVINPKEDHQRSQQSLQSDVNWPTSPGSFMCPDCNVEGTARYLFEYFERFRKMKVAFYIDYLNVKNSEEGGSDEPLVHNRLDRADESMEGRTGVAFLTHLMNDNQRDYQVKRHHQEGGRGGESKKVMSQEDWNPSEIQSIHPSEIQLSNMSRILTILSKELQQEQIQQHQRRQKRQKTNFHIDPSYLVGMPIRMYNPIDKQYHTGRIVDYKFNAPYQFDDNQCNTKPSSPDDDASVPKKIGDLTDEKICRTMYLVRFRHGVEGRRIAVHQWIYLEEHAVTVGGEICWAKVGDDPGGNGQANAASVKKGSNNGQLKSTEGSAQERKKECISCYRPVQIIFRSMLEMIPVQNLNSGLASPGQSAKSCTKNSQGGETYSSNGSSGLKVLAMGFGMAFSQVRLFLGGNGKKLMKDKQSNQENESSAEPVVRPDAIPLTSSIPPWIDQILRRSHFDDDVGMGLAVACMEKEEERRVRTWRNLSVSHLSPPGDSQPSLLIKSKFKVPHAASSSASSGNKSKKRVSVQPTVPSAKQKKPYAASSSVSSAASGSKKSKKVQAPSAKSPSKIFDDKSVEISLEDAASFGCRKCIKEIEAGVKTSREHDPDCPRKKSAKPHAVSLDVGASIGCTKCMKELASGVRSGNLTHAVDCPRRKYFSGTIPSKSANKSRKRKSPNPPVVHQAGASAMKRNGTIQKKSTPPLDLCASLGCSKCIEQLASGGNSIPNTVHDEKCPRSRRRGATGTSPAKVSNIKSGKPKGPVVHQPSASAVNGNGQCAKPSRNAKAAMKKQRYIVKTGDPRPQGGCEFCGPIVQINRKVTTTVADLQVGDLCAACQMLKNDGWLYEYHVKGRKKKFTNPDTGKQCWSVREFLQDTTDIVAKRMKNSSKLK